MTVETVCCGATLPAWHFLDVIGAGTMFVGMLMGIDAILGRADEVEASRGW